MQLTGAEFEVDMQDSSKVIMLETAEWKQAVFLCSLAPAATVLVMTPETGSNCGYIFQKLVLVRTHRLES